MVTMSWSVCHGRYIHVFGISRPVCHGRYNMVDISVVGISEPVYILGPAYQGWYAMVGISWSVYHGRYIMVEYLDTGVVNQKSHYMH